MKILKKISGGGGESGEKGGQVRWLDWGGGGSGWM